MGRVNKRRPSGTCPKCGTWRFSLHRDHVVPKWKGGPDSEDNVQYICARPEVQARLSATFARPDVKARVSAGAWADPDKRARWIAKRKVTNDARRGL